MIWILSSSLITGHKSWKLHEVFEKRMLERPHAEFGQIGKTAPNLTPHCWTQKTCNVTEDLPHGRPFLGMFRTHFMNSRVVGWRYDYNCTKEDNQWCSRWPSVDIFMFLRTDDNTLSSIISHIHTMRAQSTPSKQTSYKWIIQS